MFAKLKVWSFHSATIAWGYFKIMAGMILLIVHELINILGDVVNNDQVKAALVAMNFPAYVGLGLAILGVLTIAFRMRTVTHATNDHNEIIEIEK